MNPTNSARVSCVVCLYRGLGINKQCEMNSFFIVMQQWLKQHGDEATLSKCSLQTVQCGILSTGGIYCESVRLPCEN